MALIPVIEPLAVGTPLSEYELDLCGELGGIIWQSDAVGHQGFGVASTLTGLTGLKAKLRAYCSALDASAAAAVRECLTQWVLVRFAAVEMVGGTIGCLSGVSISSEGLRAQIKKIFLDYVPVFQLGEMSDKRDEALSPGRGAYGNGGVIRVG